MSDLVTFLKARLDEDEGYARTMIGVGERNAQAASPADMADVYGLAMTVLADPEAVKLIEQWVEGAVLPPNDMKRVLDEIEAKRAILSEHKHRSQTPESPERGFGCDTCHFDYEYGFGPGINWCPTIVALAGVYRGHPDYERQWAA